MKTSIKRAALLILASAFAAAFLSGCGTVNGFGSDVQSVGSGIRQSTR